MSPLRLAACALLTATLLAPSSAPSPAQAQALPHRAAYQILPVPDSYWEGRGFPSALIEGWLEAGLEATCDERASLLTRSFAVYSPDGALLAAQHSQLEEREGPEGWFFSYRENPGEGTEWNDGGGQEPRIRAGRLTPSEDALLLEETNGASTRLPAGLFSQTRVADTLLRLLAHGGAEAASGRYMVFSPALTPGEPLWIEAVVKPALSESDQDARALLDETLLALRDAQLKDGLPPNLEGGAEELQAAYALSYLAYKPGSDAEPIWQSVIRLSPSGALLAELTDWGDTATLTLLESLTLLPAPLC